MEVKDMKEALIGAGRGSGFHITYPSGYTLSVQWSKLANATRVNSDIDQHSMPSDELSATAVEIVVIGPDGIWCDFEVANESSINWFPVSLLHRVMQYVSIGDMDELWAFLHRQYDTGMEAKPYE
jgi:hypothetical protein